MILENPLTLQERISSTRIFNHDSKTILTHLTNGIHLRNERLSQLTHLVSATSYLENTVSRLNLSQNYNPLNFQAFMFGFNPMVNALMESSIAPLVCHNEISDENNYKFSNDLMFTVLFNLNKNAVRHGNKVKKGTKKFYAIHLETKITSFPENATFIPEGANEDMNYIEFSIKNHCNKFPDSFDYEKALNTCPQGRNGFGLYITGLIAKYLKAPVDFTEDKGKGKVSFYHPAYECDRHRPKPLRK
ncbi:hypothetical protein KY321_02960 [Candidatus Woesearchaeota archaeon]|nr:hypothetical protein [Candidatus Woesearchaeota archaeon]